MEPMISSSDGSAKLAPAIPAQFLPEPLRTWSGTRSSYPRSATVSTVFEEVVKEYPGAIALVQDDIELTYEELNRRANRLAHRLRRAGVKPETMVSCCFERSIEMIVAILAILKAGGAYVPLDPAYPEARLAFILEDAGKPLILTRKSLASPVLRGDSDRTFVAPRTPLTPKRAWPLFWRMRASR